MAAGMSPEAARRKMTMTEDTVADDSLSNFLKVRPRLLGIAYRMLGCAAAAEDLVQDVWLRWQLTEHGVVRDPAAFLAATATRLAINVVQSARVRRETYVDVALAEPVDTNAGPAVRAELGEALDDGLRMLVQTLSPPERRAFILREAFDYAYRDIAAALRLREANARQIVTRARQRLAHHHQIHGVVSHNRALYPVNAS
jgi:RNA polymerase sigma-70 factor (ECF subfamily)